MIKIFNIAHGESLKLLNNLKRETLAQELLKFVSNKDIFEGCTETQDVRLNFSNILNSWHFSSNQM